MAKNLLNKYVWLIGTIYNAGRISLEDINHRWLNTDMSEGLEIPRRTFHNWRAVIEELFDVNINCDKENGYKYYIENADDLEQGRLSSWLLNTVAVNNLIHESQSVSNRILLEDRPSGKQFLSPIIEAMKNGKCISFVHQTFKSDVPRTFHLEPYCVKEHRRRWYVLGRCAAEDRILIFALDRITELTVDEQTFVLPDDFDAEAFFSEFYGVVVNKKVPFETVRLKVVADYCKYLRTLPLHPSQKEVERTDDYSIFEFQLRPTYDFIEDIYKKNVKWQVLEPQWVADAVHDISLKVVAKDAFDKDKIQ